MHGYGVNIQAIWYEQIKKINECLEHVEVWKTRYLTHKDRVLILKSLIISNIGFEIKMRRLPDKFKKEINKVM